MSQTVFPIPSAELVDERGRITPPWYRLIVALVQRTGGTPGRVTPLPSDPLQVSLFDFAQSDGAGGGEGFSLEREKENVTIPLWFGSDAGKDEGTFVWDLSTSDRGPSDAIPFLPAVPAPAAPEAITLGASPFLFSPGFDGFTIVSGGTVSSITLSRDGGATAFATGMTTGVFPLSLADSLLITYTVLPTVTFFRR